MASNSQIGHGRWPASTQARGSATGATTSAAGAGTVERWAAMMGGIALGLLGLRRSGWGGAMLTVGGAGVFVAGALGLRLRPAPTAHRMPSPRAFLAVAHRGVHPGAWRSGGPGTRRRSLTPERTQAVVTIAADPAAVFRVWRNVANLSTLMPEFQRVEMLSASESLWVVAGGADAPRWRAVLDRIDEDRLLTWHTVGETVLPHRASLMLGPAPGDRGTEVRLTLVYRVPAAEVKSRLGVAPEAQAQDALWRLKQRIETGEWSTAERQPRDQGAGQGSGAREATE